MVKSSVLPDDPRLIERLPMILAMPSFIAVYLTQINQCIVV